MPARNPIRGPSGSEVRPGADLHARTSAAARAQAPTGAVTLCFTDVQGSTSLWEEHPEAMRVALVIHDELLRQVLAEHGGYEVKTEGDAFMVAFTTPCAALAWCRDVQLALAEIEWPPPIAVRGGLLVRMGLHWGQPDCRENPLTGRMDYFGPVVNRAARVAGAAHGGQVLLSAEAWECIAADGGVPGLQCADRGEVKLKGIRDGVRLIEAIPTRFAGERSFPPPRGEDTLGPTTAAPHAPGLDASLRLVCDGLLARAQVRRLRGRVEAARADLQAALACARTGDFGEIARRAQLGLAMDAGPLAAEAEAPTGVSGAAAAPPQQRATYATALAQLRLVEAEARAADDAGVLARALLEMARRHNEAGGLAEALACADEAVGLFEARLDPDGMAGCFATIAAVRRRSGDPRGAEGLYRRALGIVEASGSYRWRAEILVGLARACFEQGRADIGDLVERARENARSGLPDDAGWAGFLLGCVRFAAGDAQGAREPLLEALSAFAEARSHEAHGRAQLVLAAVEWTLGERERGRRDTQRLREGAAASGARVGQAAAEIQLAAFAAAEGHMAVATASMASAEAALGPLPHHALHTELGFVRALLQAADGAWGPLEALVEGGVANTSVLAGAVARCALQAHRAAGRIALA